MGIEKSLIKYEEELSGTDGEYSRVVLKTASEHFDDVMNQITISISKELEKDHMAIMGFESDLLQLYKVEKEAVAGKIIYNKDNSNKYIRMLHLAFSHIINLNKGILYLVTDFPSKEKRIFKNVGGGYQLEIFFFDKKQKKKILELLINRKFTLWSMVTGEKGKWEIEDRNKIINLKAVDYLIEEPIGYRSLDNYWDTGGAIASIEITFKKEHKEKVMECIEKCYMPYKEKIEALI